MEATTETTTTNEDLPVPLTPEEADFSVFVKNGYVTVEVSYPGEPGQPASTKQARIYLAHLFATYQAVNNPQNNPLPPRIEGAG